MGVRGMASLRKEQLNSVKSSVLHDRVLEVRSSGGGVCSEEEVYLAEVSLSNHAGHMSIQFTTRPSHVPNHVAGSARLAHVGHVCPLPPAPGAAQEASCAGQSAGVTPSRPRPQSVWSLPELLEQNPILGPASELSQHRASKHPSEGRVLLPALQGRSYDDERKEHWPSRSTPQDPGFHHP